jgi:hypothetical protein
MAQRAAEQELRAEGNLTAGLSRVSVHAVRRFSRGAETVALAQVQGDASALTGVLPGADRYTMSYRELLDTETLEPRTARQVCELQGTGCQRCFAHASPWRYALMTCCALSPVDAVHWQGGVRGNLYERGTRAPWRGQQPAAPRSKSPWRPCYGLSD